MPKPLAEKTIEKRIKTLCENKEFSQKYLKNIVVMVAHWESINARTKKCMICRVGSGRCNFYNKRHNVFNIGFSTGRMYLRGKDGRIRRLLDNDKWGHTGSLVRDHKDITWDYLCLDCLLKVETLLNHKFIYDYAP